MADTEWATRWSEKAESTSPDGSTATLMLLIAGVLKQVKPDNLSVGKIKAGTPASASASGVAGQIRWDSTHLYVCVATDTWVRCSLATW